MLFTFLLGSTFFIANLFHPISKMCVEFLYILLQYWYNTGTMIDRIVPELQLAYTHSNISIYCDHHSSSTKWIFINKKRKDLKIHSKSLSLNDVSFKNNGTYICKVYNKNIKFKAQSSLFVGGKTNTHCNVIYIFNRWIWYNVLTIENI